MEKVKGWALAFVVGGLYAVVGQVIMTLLSGALGADFAYLGPLTLLGMGVVALVLYIPGVQQRIAAVSGFGSILPFNGFAGGVPPTPTRAGSRRPESPAKGWRRP